MTPDWCRDETMARLLDIPVSTFRDYVEKGWLPKGVKVGKHRLWSRSQVNQTLEQLAEGSPESDPVRRGLREVAHGKKAGARRDAA